MNETDLRDENWNGEWVLDLHTVQHISSDLACATSEARKPLLSRDPVLLENLRVTSRRHEWIGLVSSWVWSPPGFGLFLDGLRGSNFDPFLQNLRDGTLLCDTRAVIYIWDVVLYDLCSDFLECVFHCLKCMYCVNEAPLRLCTKDTS